MDGRYGRKIAAESENNTVNARSGTGRTEASLQSEYRMDWKQLLYVSLSTDVVMGALRGRSAQNKVTVLAYHELAEDDTDVEAWTVVRKSEFLRQIDYLARHYDIVSLDEALKRFPVASSARPLAVITFDDGARGNADILLPIVERLQVPVTVYIATQQIVEQTPYWFDQVMNALQVDRVVDVDLRKYELGEYRINRQRGPENWNEIERLLESLKSLEPHVRTQAVVEMMNRFPKEADRRPNSHIQPMTIDEVKALGASQFITIGSHSHCHNLLTQLAPAAVQESLQTSKTLLESWTGKKIEHFAYPNGSHNDTTVEIVRQSGFRSAVTFESGLWKREHSLYRIPRVSVGRYDTIQKFKLGLVGGFRGMLSRAA